MIQTPNYRIRLLHLQRSAEKEDKPKIGFKTTKEEEKECRPNQTRTLE